MDSPSRATLKALFDAAPRYEPFSQADFASGFQALAERYRIPAAVAVVIDAHGTLGAAGHGTVEAASSDAVDPSTIFAIASMTKAITTTAALQLVERGVLTLHDPVDPFLPSLRDLPVLEGFDNAGAPCFSQARHRVTLHQLLTHTAGFAYPWNHPLMQRYGFPEGAGPYLIHEPGTRWHYGINIDWVGRLIETATGQDLETYFQRQICEPLEMTDTSFVVPPAKLHRMASSYQRNSFGILCEQPRVQPPAPKFCNGGGGLYSTAADYARFLRMLLLKGMSPGGHRVLEAESVRIMSSNQVGEMEAGRMSSTTPDRSCEVDFHPGESDAFSYGFLLNRKGYPSGRAPGSLSWAGIRNTFYWLDPHTGIAAVLLAQFQPFCDPAALRLLTSFERSVYATLIESSL